MVDQKWLAENVRTKDGLSFALFHEGNKEMKQTIQEFVEGEQSDEPEALAADNRTASAYIGFANYRVSKSRAFHDKAKAIVSRSLRESGIKGNDKRDEGPKYYADMIEELEDWKGISDALHERLWNGKTDLKRFSRMLDQGG